MEKEFNITGKCIASKHYMADVSKKLEQIHKMVKKGQYFTINRPRQYGKTTTLYHLATILRATGEYIVFNIGFDGIGDDVFKNERHFSQEFVDILADNAHYHAPDLEDWLREKSPKTKSLKMLSNVITQLANKTDKKVVLLIDEVDKSSNNQLFVSFLAMLRNKYLARDEVKTFHAIVLAGVHDVKSLKLKLRADSESKNNSPWNIAADFEVDMNLQPSEIKPMLDEYSADKGVQMYAEEIAHRLFYYTSGYPFLVSKLCKMLDENRVPLKNEKKWTHEDVDAAARQLIKETNANFDSLIKNLEDNQELYNTVYNIAVEAETRTFNIHNASINLGVLYGIFADRNGLVMHNRIYREVIVDYMIDKVHQIQIGKNVDYGGGYKNADKSINMEAVLTGFQAFMSEQYSKHDRTFLERNGRLVFLAFMKPILNGGGYDFKEPQVSDERRLDVILTYFQHRYLAELKIWRGQVAHEKGLNQLADYIDRLGLSEGYLIIFDHAKIMDWDKKWLTVKDKKVLAIWV